MEKLKVTEHKDILKQNRIRVKHVNGNIMYASTQGYANKSDASHAAKTTAIALIDYYRNELTEDEVGELKDILKSLDKN